MSLKFKLSPGPSGGGPGCSVAAADCYPANYIDSEEISNKDRSDDTRCLGPLPGQVFTVCTTPGIICKLWLSLHRAPGNVARIGVSRRVRNEHSQRFRKHEESPY